MFEAVGKVMLHERLCFSMVLMLLLAMFLYFASVRAICFCNLLYFAMCLEALYLKSLCLTLIWPWWFQLRMCFDIGLTLVVLEHSL